MKKIFSIAFLVLLIDQVSKIYVKTHFPLSEGVEVFDWFHIRFVENPGMAYGVKFGGFVGKIALSVLRLVLISFMVYYIYKWSKKCTSWFFIIPAGLIFAGAVGNLIDSIFYGIMFDKGTTFDSTYQAWVNYYGIANLNFEGYAPLFGGCVVDMFSFPIIDTVLPEWVPFWGGESFQFFDYIFNVADAAITIGAIILIGTYLFNPKVFPKEWLK